MDSILQEIYDGILEGRNAQVVDSLQAALSQGQSPENILNLAMIPAMRQAGQLFEEGEYFLPEMLLSARTMQGGMTVLKPYLINQKVSPAGKVAIGTVKGDQHDIGKNLVAILLEGAGFEVVDLGVNVDTETFVQTVREQSVDMLALSALLTTTMPSMKTTIDALIQAGLRDRVKILVGGAPITESYAHQIGADGYAPDASRAATLALSLMKASNSYA
ncbi:MAG TPA: corrinoid protein [Anaerolineaceae bacterium]|nr:corrinoid protein [Anaerolineaceae bacterium]HPN52405.1 corrinoid protein [Anaerolineaceae bacterium]